MDTEKLRHNLVETALAAEMRALVDLPTEFHGADAQRRGEHADVHVVARRERARGVHEHARGAQVVEHLAGARSLPATVDLVKTRTRQFARRQDTWFRSLSECQWLPINDNDTPSSTVNRILQQFGV